MKCFKTIVFLILNFKPEKNEFDVMYILLLLLLLLLFVMHRYKYNTWFILESVMLKRSFFDETFNDVSAKIDVKIYKHTDHTFDHV